MEGNIGHIGVFTANFYKILHIDHCPCFYL